MDFNCTKGGDGCFIWDTDVWDIEHFCITFAHLNRKVYKSINTC